jgi:hypothetical protein
MAMWSVELDGGTPGSTPCGRRTREDGSHGSHGSHGAHDPPQRRHAEDSAI